MGFYRGPQSIPAENLIFATDDLSLRSLNGTTIMKNMLNQRGDGVITGGAIENGMLRYNGSSTKVVFPDSYVLHGSPIDLDATGAAGGPEAYTLECWFKILSDPGGDTTAGMQLFGNNSAVGVGIQLMRQSSENKINFGYRTNSNDYSVGADLQIGVWYHVAGTRGTTKGVTIYLDGVSVFNSSYVSTDMNIDASTDPMHFGQTALRITGYLDGYMPIARIYKRELTQAQVQYNYNAQKERFE
jgi:hypothetical protein